MQQLGLLVGAAWDTMQGAGGSENSTDEIAIRLVWSRVKVMISVSDAAYCVASRTMMCCHGRLSISGGMCTPLQSKTILE